MSDAPGPRPGPAAPPSPSAAGPRRRALLAALALAAPVTAGGCSADAPARPAAGPPGKDVVVMLMRHAEQPYAGDVGQDREGEEAADSLAGRGWRRAEALPGLFPPKPHALLPRPVALIAQSDRGGRAGAHLARQTLTPLSEALRVPVRAEFGSGAEARAGAAALAAGGPALVCWAAAGIPALVRGLGAGGVVGVPAVWPDRCDVVWLFNRRGGRWAFRELGQGLLPGDV
ncbi:hypothetical protein [Streptomyces sp. NPDC089919]|uniref:hypothetical protein n=1 Tax=Streptomyces sp. NPDC089919 TaxID=3155188 RepID=UPI003431C740